MNRVGENLDVKAVERRETKGPRRAKGDRKDRPQRQPREKKDDAAKEPKEEGAEEGAKE